MGLASGRLNLDAKVRRESTDIEDFLIAHIGGMGGFRKRAANCRAYAGRSPDEGVAGRYASLDAGDGKGFENGELELVELRDIAADGGQPVPEKRKQEPVENLINDYIVAGL